jgi:hypothetical protein
MQLQADKLAVTLAQLENRIRERFPTSSLLKLAGELTEIARQVPRRTQQFRRVFWPLRLLGWLLALCLPAIIFYLVAHGSFQLETDGWQLLEGIDAGISSLVFLGGAIFFVVTMERRVRRNRALAAIAELRGLAHIIDMHQLDKDPERTFGQYTSTASSPKVSLTPFELGRYLDYCSEMLSLISKVCVLYGQGFDDDVVLGAVDDIEDLAGGLSRRIWQKIMLLENLESRAEQFAVSGAEKVKAEETPKVSTSNQN